MLLTLIRKELLEHLSSFRFLVITAMSLLLIFTSVLVMYNNYQSRMENHAAVLPTLGPTQSLLQPAPLSILVKGMDDTMCQQLDITDSRIDFGASEQYYNVLFRLFTTPDLFYIVKVILSLCAILIAFNLVSGEKEAHTMALALSNSVNRTKLLFGKWIGGMLCLCLPFVISILVVAVIFSFAPTISMDIESWLQLGLVALSSMLYLAFFFTLGLAVSCLYSRSSSALVVSLFLWVMLVFVTPGLGALAASRISDTPSSQTVWLREYLATIKLNWQEVQKNGGYERITEYPEVDRMKAEYRASFERQLTLSKALTRISPTAVYTLLATDFAGTGMLNRIRQKNAATIQSMMLKQAVEQDENQLPRFEYRRADVREILLDEGLVNLVIILLQGVAVFAAAYVLFLRYDAR